MAENMHDSSGVGDQSEQAEDAPDLPSRNGQTADATTPAKPKARAKAKPRQSKPLPSQVTDRVSTAIAAGPQAEAQLIAELGIGMHVVNGHAGLSPAQRKFLLMRRLCESDQEAAKFAGIPFRTINQLLEEHAIFRRAYSALWTNPAEFSLTMMDNLLPKAVDVLEDALSSAKVTDRLRATRILFESRGILKPEAGEVNEAERALARQLKERGQAVPPSLQGYIIEGEATTVE